MESQEGLLERHPDTLFQSAHVASASEDLGYVGRLLDRYLNLYVDISARIAELGRQPYTARKFFLTYADRILYGTDHAPRAAWQRIYMRFADGAIGEPLPEQGPEFGQRGIAVLPAFHGQTEEFLALLLQVIPIQDQLHRRPPGKGPQDRRL